ncbi:FR47-like [Trinorchestia longiramus]|nr:FR47-like [Trinorchestia longiramus]
MSQPSSQSLAVVPPEEYQQFADALLEFRPHSYQVSGGSVSHSYQVSGGPVPHSYQIEIMLRGHLKFQHFDLLNSALYAPADATLRHQLAVVAPVGAGKEIFVFKIFWNEDSLSDDEVCQLLLTLPGVRWNEPLLISQIPTHLRTRMDAILLKLSEGELHLFTTMIMEVLTLAPADIPPVPELPTGYYYGTLDGSYGEEILKQWSGAYISTVDSVSNILDTLPSAAVFHRKNSQNIHDEGASDCQQNDELVSHSLYKFVSDLGMTYTKENHRRKGLARAATLQLAHTVDKESLPVVCIINETVTRSMNMHLKLGYKPYTKVQIAHYFPRGFDFKRKVDRFRNFEESYSKNIRKWEETWREN